MFCIGGWAINCCWVSARNLRSLETGVLQHECVFDDEDGGDDDEDDDEEGDDDDNDDDEQNKDNSIMRHNQF